MNLGTEKAKKKKKNLRKEREGVVKVLLGNICYSYS